MEHLDHAGMRRAGVRAFFGRAPTAHGGGTAYMERLLSDKGIPVLSGDTSLVIFDGKIGRASQRCIDTLIGRGSEGNVKLVHDLAVKSMRTFESGRFETLDFDSFYVNVKDRWRKGCQGGHPSQRDVVQFHGEGYDLRNLLASVLPICNSSMLVRAAPLDGMYGGRMLMFLSSDHGKAVVLPTYAHSYDYIQLYRWVRPATCSC